MNPNRIGRMKIELNPALKPKDWQRLSELFQLVEWDERTPKEIEDSFQKSSFVCLVLQDDIIIGFGRTVDDGKYYALLVDVVVHPENQGKGVGKSIIDTLVKQLKGYHFVTLTAAPNKEGFYHKIGWKKQKSAFLLPKDEKQLKEHCEK